MDDQKNKAISQESEEKKLSKIDLMHHLLHFGTIGYTIENFNNEEFVSKLLDWMQQQFNIEALYSKDENIHGLAYKIKGGISGTLGISTGFKLFYILDQQKIYFDIRDDKWFENPESKFSISKLVSESNQAGIQNFIFQYLYNDAIGNEADLKIDKRNHFIEKPGEQKSVWLAKQLNDSELLLVFLALSSIKTNNGTLDENKELSWYLLITTEKAQFVAFNKREEEVQLVPCNESSIKVKKEIGRDPVEYKDISFLSTRNNDELLYHIQHVNLEKPDDRIREIARLNWIYKKKNEDSNQFAMALIKRLIEQTHNPFDELAVLFMEYSAGDREKVFVSYTEDNKLLELLHQILNHSDTNDLLTKWIEKWEISYIDSVAINELLFKAIQDAVQANNILPFHRFVRENFLKKNTDELNPVLFDITFCNHLIRCGLGKEAKKILQKRLKELPDETLSDLLPGNDVDLMGPAAGQIIKVTILEMLASLETEKNAIDYKCQIARLQPLVEEKINKLIEVSEPKVAGKGAELMAIIHEGGLSGERKTPSPAKYNQLETKLVDKHLRHPASQKGKNFSNFQKWLATVKIPDYSMLKSYSEKLSPQKHAELNEIITDIKYALNIEKLEVYISRGEKSVGINSFESDPSFLIIGGDHLDKNSAHFLHPQELKFAIAVELAHLYFKHARITSSDVWKGTLEKGYFVVDTVLSIFPAVGLFTKSIQGIGKLNAVSSFLQKTKKLGQVSTQSKEILNASEQMVNLYKSKFSKDKKNEDKEMEFLATSRIIQLTADRCAFIFTRDIQAAIRAMFLVSKTYYTELPVVEKYGLKDFLLKKNENGTYRHQELAIRLASLFSFYLSDEYEMMIKKLIKH